MTSETAKAIGLLKGPPFITQPGPGRREILSRRGHAILREINTTPAIMPSHNPNTGVHTTAADMRACTAALELFAAGPELLACLDEIIEHYTVWHQAENPIAQRANMILRRTRRLMAGLPAYEGGPR